MNRPAKDAFARVEEEILRERAAALKRISEALAELLSELGALGAPRGQLSGPERASRATAYRALWERARLYRWYLEVQREALGLRGHDVLDELYPRPAPILE
ncbi:MAG TPA: hypothetical protein VN375_17055 [Vicinamibacteria bacterium]|nr:hypothetical protein [Vicinamibacteria bacterium]